VIWAALGRVQGRFLDLPDVERVLRPQVGPTAELLHELIEGLPGQVGPLPRRGPSRSRSEAQPTWAWMSCDQQD
jgi:hypothetical protein